MTQDKPRKPTRAQVAAAARREQEQRERRRQLLVVVASALVLVVIVGIGVWIQSTRDTTGQGSQTAFPSTSVSLDGTQVAAADTYGLGVGNPDAKVKVEVFEDFLCPFCREYEAAGRTQLRQAAADGDAYVVYRPIAFLGDYSTRALNAFYVVLDAAGPDVALKFHDLLYESQPSETGDQPGDDWLIEKAVEAGATEADVTAGIDDSAYAQTVTDATDDASKRKVNATPTVFAGGTAVSGQTIDGLVTATEEAITSGQ